MFTIMCWVLRRSNGTEAGFGPGSSARAGCTPAKVDDLFNEVAKNYGNDINVWLGRSQWPDPYFNGQLDEFRIYSGVLSDASVAASFANGPDASLGGRPWLRAGFLETGCGRVPVAAAIGLRQADWVSSGSSPVGGGHRQVADHRTIVRARPARVHLRFCPADT